MYLKQAVFENSGSIRMLNLTLEFADTGQPKPLVLVGGNGGGKTNFLSTVADALFEAAAVHYDNVLPSKGISRNWFRVVGGPSITIGAAGGFSLLRFEDAGTARFFKEKAGIVDATEVKARVSEEFSNQIFWNTDEPLKQFSIDDGRSRVVFSEGVYVYFPSSRSEPPYWLNRDAVPDVTFDTSPSFSKRLTKPIYVEHALEQFKQWLIGVLADTRSEVSLDGVEKNSLKWSLTGNPLHALMSTNVLKVCNDILRAIMSDAEVSFTWLGRKSPEKVAILRGARIILPNLDALSAGQAILLGMFGTVLRYGDLSRGGPTIDLASIEGICLIDEVDAHIHIELQHKVLPRLIKLFPKIQFILSSHSPLFVLGLEQEFGANGIQVIEMPTGVPVNAESYSEFGRALEALTATSTFTERVIAEARQVGKPIIYVEGETDAPYLKHAAAVLGKQHLLDRCDIEWVGAKDEGGQGFHTGKDALKHTLSVLRANPRLANRHILLFYDNDSTSVDQNYDGVSVRKLPINSENKKVKAGIENLLSEDCIDDRFYETIEKAKPNGDVITTKTLRKIELCKAMCMNGTAEQFSAFREALAIIESYLNEVSNGASGAQGAC